MFGEAIEKSIHLRLLFSYGCLVSRWHLRADSCGASRVSNWLQIDFHALAEMSTFTKRRSFALLFDNVRNLCMNLQLGRRFKITKILSTHFLSRFHLVSILFWTNRRPFVLSQRSIRAYKSSLQNKFRQRYLPRFFFFLRDIYELLPHFGSYRWRECKFRLMELHVKLVGQNIKVIRSQQQEVLNAWNTFVNAIINTNKEFTCYFFCNSDVLVEIDTAVGKVTVHRFCKLCNFICILLFHLDNIGHMLVFCRMRLPTPRFYPFRHVHQHQDKLFFWYLLIIICIIAPEAYLHPLLDRPHAQFQEELHKLVMINPLVSVCIDLIYHPFTQQLWQVKILFHSLNGNIILVLSLNQAKVHRAQIRR